jgi:hypothetical protein
MASEVASPSIVGEEFLGLIDQGSRISDGASSASAVSATVISNWSAARTTRSIAVMDTPQ